MSITIELLIQAMKLLPGGNAAAAISDITLESIKRKSDHDDADIDDLQAEVTRQEVINRISSVQARALQELAIAKRIDSAEEVEIEEFYEGSGEGGVGLSASNDTHKFGAHGSGSKITRRIYRFKGFRDEEQVIYEQRSDLTEDDNSEK